MNNSLFLKIGLLLVLFTSACANKNQSLYLDGTWELRHVIGIQVAGVSPDFKPGNGNLYKFRDDTYEKWSDGARVSSGTFKLAKEDLPINNNKANYSLLLDDQTKTYIKLSRSQLVIFNGQVAADGTESTYEKQ
ncbi:hypothetical protein [Pedobacter antarcticus]|uniref:hypothetical protein n=1 Tax=Pedobacter antarcticus TaxID=34086 RepID=UPI00292FB63C|nr:hypothetical protein [Pedobacter antarcticus]